MNKLAIIIFTTLFLTQCQEEKPAMERAAILKCECLEKFDKEKGNIMEALNCSDEIGKMEEFKGLNPIELSEEMEKICPNASIPFEEIQQ